TEQQSCTRYDSSSESRFLQRHVRDPPLVTCCDDRTIGIQGAAREGGVQTSRLAFPRYPTHNPSVIWFLLCIWFVWLNATMQMNQINQTNQKDQMNQTNQ